MDIAAKFLVEKFIPILYNKKSPLFGFCVYLTQELDICYQ